MPAAVQHPGLLYQAQDGKLSLVSEKDTKGAVYSLNVFQVCKLWLS